MLVRTLSAVALVPIVVALALVGGPMWAVAWSIGSVIGTAEGYDLASAAGLRPDRAVGYPLAALIVLTTLSSAPDALRIALAAGVIAAFAAQLARRPADRSSADWLASLAFPSAIGVLTSFLVLVRALPEGMAWTVVLLALVWANDTGAYLGGKAFGRTPFFPSLSPRKTREGALTGTLASVGIGVALPALAALVPGGAPSVASLARMSPLVLGTIGLAVSFAGPAGDLSQSFLKRQVGVKDSGQLIPGHGGVLDRTDSLLFAAPVVYLAARWIGTGG